MRLNPKHFPTLFTIPALIVLLALGTWQVQRLQWKTALITAVNTRAAMPAMTMPTTVADFPEVQYRRVKLWGKYLHDKEIHLFTGARSERGEPGYDILTPLQREDGSVVLIDRGWVDSDHKKAETRPETLTEGVVEIEGMVHKGEKPGRFTPDNDLTKNLWFWIDIDTAKEYVGYPLQDLYVRRLRAEGDFTQPIGGEASLTQRNDHLQYAITWYSLAIILLVIYVLYRRKNG